MSKNKTKKELDPNVVGSSLETTSEELTAKVEEVVESPIEEDSVTADVEEVPAHEPVPEVKEEEPEPIPVPLEPGPVIVEEPEEKKEEEPIPVPVEPGPVIIEEPKEEVKAPVEKSSFAGKYVLCIYATARKSVEDISDELNTNRRFVADNIIIDCEKNRVVLETSDNTSELKKTQKKYLSAGVKTVIDEA